MTQTKDKVTCMLCESPMQIKSGWGFCYKCGLSKRVGEQPQSKLGIYTMDWVLNHRRLSYQREYARAKYLSKYLSPKERTLDVGCASGNLVDILYKMGFNAEGVDSSEIAINLAQELSQGKFYVDDDLLGFIQPKYGLITANHILEHLSNPNRIIYGVKRLLDGYFYISVPNLDMYSKYSIWRSVNNGTLFANDHEYCYSPKSLSMLLTRNGFKIVDMFTKTYSPIIQQQTVMTLYHLINGDIDNPIPSGELARAISISLTDNPIINTLMNPFNRLSELGNRGEELCVLCHT